MKPDIIVQLQEQIVYMADLFDALESTAKKLPEQIQIAVNQERIDKITVLADAIIEIERLRSVKH